MTYCDVCDEKSQCFAHHGTRLKSRFERCIFGEQPQSRRSDMIFCAVPMTPITMGSSFVSRNSCWPRENVGRGGTGRRTERGDARILAILRTRRPLAATLPLSLRAVCIAGVSSAPRSNSSLERILHFVAAVTSTNVHS